MSLAGSHWGGIDEGVYVYLAGLAVVGIGMERKRAIIIDEMAWLVGWLTGANGSPTGSREKTKYICMTSFCCLLSRDLLVVPDVIGAGVPRVRASPEAGVKWL